MGGYVAAGDCLECTFDVKGGKDTGTIFVSQAAETLGEKGGAVGETDAILVGGGVGLDFGLGRGDQGLRTEVAEDVGSIS